MQTPTLRIGPYTLAQPFVLAPMAGVTDKPFRALCRRLGAGRDLVRRIDAMAIRAR